MKQEKAERVVEIMKDLRGLKNDLGDWENARGYKQGDNTYISVYGSDSAYIGKYIPFGTLKAMVMPIIEERIDKLEIELNNI